MHRNTMMGLLAGSIIGMTFGMYAASQVSPREQRKMMKRGRRILSTAANMFGGINI